MNERVTNTLEKELERQLEQRPPEREYGHSREVEQLLGSVPALLGQVRRLMLEAEAKHNAAVQEVASKAEDEIARLRAGHIKRMDSLMHAKRRIEAMRDA